MLIHPHYEGLYGSIGRVGKSSVKTLFYQFLGFPLFPQGSYWVTGTMVTSFSDVKVMELKRDRRSIVAGYLRGWTAVGAFWLLGAGLLFAFLPGQQIYDGDPMPFGRSIIVPIGIAAGLFAALAAVAVYVATRHAPSADELARRAVFQGFLGQAVDPALLDAPWSARDDLKRGMADIAEGLGLGKSYDVFDRWPEIALRPELRSPDYLRMALTVARLARAAPETGEDERPIRDAASLPELEERIWARLVEIDPAVRTARPVSE